MLQPHQNDPRLPEDRLTSSGKPAELSPTASVERNVADRGSSLFAHHLAVIEHSFAPTEVVTLAPAAAVFWNAAGKPIGGETLAIEHRPEDVVGVLPYAIENGELYVYATECLRPALAARSIVGLSPLGDTAGTRILSELGGYLRDVDGLTTAVIDILSRKAALVANGEPHILGGPLIPNASVSAELVLPTAVRVHRPTSKEYHVPGDLFDAGRLTVELTAQQVRDSFYLGRLSDPRLFLSVSKLHDQLGATHAHIGELAHTAPYLAEVRRQLARGNGSLPIATPVLRTVNAVERYQHPVANDPRVVVSASVAVGDGATHQQLFRSMQLVVRSENAAGIPIEAPFRAEAIVRQHDTLLVVVLARSGDEVFIPVNIGARAALEIRDRTPHVIHTVTGARNLEGVSGILTAPFDEAARVRERVREIVRASTGHECAEDPILTPIAGYFSPGFNTSGYRVAVACIDLDSESGMRLPPGAALAEPGALRDAGVRDLSLRLTAQIAGDILELPCTPRAEHLCDAERVEFQRLLLSESSVWRFIREHSPRLRERMRDKPLLASIINKRINDGGLEIERRSTEDPEHFFFNSLMQGFTVHQGEHPLRVAQLLWHDVWHYEHPDTLPFTRDSSGHLVPADLPAYRSAVTLNEVDGVMFSDVVLVELYGSDDFERELGYGSLAGLLRSAGITDRDEQRAVVARAHEEGELDRRIVRVLRDPTQRTYYDPVVREKLLGIYVRDTLESIPQLYEAWTAMPRVAALALAMDARTLDQRSPGAERFSTRLTDLVDRRDGAARCGRNPLREALGHLRTYGVFQQALKLEFIRGLLEERGAAHREVAEIEALTSELVNAYHDLKVAAQSIESIEESDTTVAAFRLMRSVSSGVVDSSRTLLERLLRGEEPLAREERARLERWTHAPFPVLPFDPRAEKRFQTRIDECLERSITTAE